MATMLDFVSEARTAAHRGWERARAVFVQRPPAVDGDALAQLIEEQVIPRLIIAHQPPRSGRVHDMPVIPQGFVDAFARAALTEEAWMLLGRLDSLFGEAVPMEALCLNVLAPTARRLGEYWEEDSCDFIDVTMGLWRMQELVRCLSARTPGRGPIDNPPMALFAALEGEQHLFGLKMAEEFFSRAGWATWNTPPLDPDALVQLVSGRPFDLIGLTISCDGNIPIMARTVAALRRASRNPELIVIVGGRLMVARPELVEELGADAAPADAVAAVAMAERLVSGRRVLARETARH